MASPADEDARLAALRIRTFNARSQADMSRMRGNEALSRAKWDEAAAHYLSGISDALVAGLDLLIEALDDDG